MLEIMALLVPPMRRQGVPPLFQGLSDQPKVALRRGGKSRIRRASPRWRSMNPCSHCAPAVTAQTCSAWTPPRRSRLHLRQFSERGCVGHAREGGKGVGPHLVSGCSPWVSYSNDQGAHFCP